MAAYNSIFIHNEQNLERESVLTARTINHGFEYGEDDAAATRGQDPFNKSTDDVAGADRWSQNQSAKYGWCNTHEPTLTGAVDYKVDPWANALRSPVFQISLSDLFPFLKTNQLPLFMMKDQLFIELHFSPANNNKADRLCMENTSANPATVNIDPIQTKLICDYLYYPQEMMEQYEQVNANLSFQYVDYRLSEMSVDPASAKDLIRNVGGAGRIVSKIIQAVQNLDVGEAVAGDAKCLTGPYHAIASQNESGNAPNGTGGVGSVAGATGGWLNANVRANNDFLYPIDIDNSARLFHTITSTEGKVPFVSRDEYNRQGGALTSRNIEGIVQSGNITVRQTQGLQGHFFYQAFKMKPERIDGRGIEVYMKYLSNHINTANPNLTEREGLAPSTLGYTHRVWVELVKYMTLRDGFVEIGYV